MGKMGCFFDGSEDGSFGADKKKVLMGTVVGNKVVGRGAMKYFSWITSRTNTGGLPCYWNFCENMCNQIETAFLAGQGGDFANNSIVLRGNVHSGTTSGSCQALCEPNANKRRQCVPCRRNSAIFRKCFSKGQCRDRLAIPFTIRICQQLRHTNVFFRRSLC